MAPLLDSGALAKVTTGHHTILNYRGTLVQPSQLSHRQLNFRDSEAFQSRARKIVKEIIQAHIYRVSVD